MAERLPDSPVVGKGNADDSLDKDDGIRSIKQARIMVTSSDRVVETPLAPPNEDEDSDDMEDDKIYRSKELYSEEDMELIQALKGKILSNYALSIDSRHLTLSLFHVLNKNCIPTHLPAELIGP